MESNKVKNVLFVEAKHSMEDLFSIKVVKIMIKLAGFYPIGNDKLQFIVNNLLLLILCSTFSGMIGVGIYCIMSIASGDINSACLTAWYAMYALFQFCILLTVVLRRDRLFSFQKFIIDNYWKRKYSRGEMSELEACNRSWILFAIAYVTLNTCCTTLNMTMPLLEMRMNNDSEKRFPIPVFFTLPAHMYETPIYEIFYIMEVVQALVIWSVDNASSFYSVSLSLYVAAQFKLLGLRAKKLFLDAECSSDDQVSKNLKQFLREHLMLIHHMNEQNDIMGFVYFVCTMSSAISITFSLFVALSDVTGNSILFAIINALRLALVLVYAYGNCYATQQIVNYSESLDFTIYEILTELSLMRKCGKSVVHQKSLLIMHRRAQSACSVNVLFFGPLTFAVLKSIVNTACSYYGEKYGFFNGICNFYLSFMIFILLLLWFLFTAMLRTMSNNN